MGRKTFARLSLGLVLSFLILVLSKEEYLFNVNVRVQLVPSCMSDSTTVGQQRLLNIIPPQSVIIARSPAVMDYSGTTKSIR